MKKLIALVLALALVLASCAVAFADANSYTITIDNAVSGETYTAYKIFDVTYSGSNSSYTAPEAATDVPGNPDSGHQHTAYSYTISTASEWWSTVTSNHATTEVDAGTTFDANDLTFTKTTTANIWNVQSKASFNAATFAATLDAAKNGKQSAASVVAGSTGDGAFVENSTTDHDNASYNYTTGKIVLKVGNSGAGYYFVDTGLGALCSLDTTENNALIRDKNSIPGIDKKVSDNASSGFGTTADVNIGDRVYYKIEVTDGTGTNSAITVRDTLSAGQTLDIGSFAVEDDDTATTSITYTVTYNNNTSKLKTTGTAGTNVQSGTFTNTHADESFNIVFPDTYVSSLGNGKKITITYSAILNEDAVIAGDGNPNTASLDYSAQSSQEKTTIVYTYAGALYKYNSSAVELADAEFTMVNSSSAAMYFKKIANGSSTAPTVYRYSSSYTSSTADATNTLVTPASGAIVIIGLDLGTYTLTETVPPAGYNKLTGTLTLEVESTDVVLAADKEFTIPNSTVKAIFDNGKHDTNSVTYQLNSDSIIGVLNQAGTELPSTGGIGTTIFYIVGGLLVIGAAVILVARRKAHE